MIFELIFTNVAFFLFADDRKIFKIFSKSNNDLGMIETWWIIFVKRWRCWFLLINANCFTLKSDQNIGNCFFSSNNNTSAVQDLQYSEFTDDRKLSFEQNCTNILKKPCWAFNSNFGKFKCRISGSVKQSAMFPFWLIHLKNMINCLKYLNAFYKAFLWS